MSNANTQAQRTLDQENLAKRVRLFARRLLEKGVAPHAISFTLTYIATELGLAIAKNPVDVFPVILSAVSQAASSSTDDDEDMTEVKSNSLFPTSTTIN